MARPSGEHEGGYLPWFYDRYRSDERVQLLTVLEDYAYRRLLEHQWKTGSIPSDPEQCFRLTWKLGTEEALAAPLRSAIQVVLGEFFLAAEDEPDRLVNPTMCEVAAAHRERRLATYLRTSKAGMASAAARAEAAAPSADTAFTLSPKTNTSGTSVEQMYDVRSTSVGQVLGEMLEGSGSGSGSGSVSSDAIASSDSGQEGVQEVAPATGKPRDYTLELVVLVNRHLSAKLGGAYKPLVASVERESARKWEESGIPLDVALRAVQEVLEAFRSRPGNRQPFSLSYFDARVRRLGAMLAAGTDQVLRRSLALVELVVAYANDALGLDQLLTPERENLIRRRLDESNEHELLYAIDGAKADQWRQKTGNTSLEDLFGRRGTLEKLARAAGYRPGKTHRMASEEFLAAFMASREGGQT